MLSRVASHIYWMGRYIERAENYARFININFDLSLELETDVPTPWKPLLELSKDEVLYESMYKKRTKSKVIYFLGFDIKNPNSIYNCIINARENARAVRPEITKEVWEQINHLHYYVKEALEKKKWEKKDPRKYFSDIIKGTQLLYGMFDETISKTEGWHFGKVGKLLERADKASKLLSVNAYLLQPQKGSVGSMIDLIRWTSVLKSLSAYDMYLKEYGKLTAKGITEFIIFDKRCPRSILRCLISVERSLQTIQQEDGDRKDVRKQLNLVRLYLENSTIETVFNIGMNEYLDDLQLKLNNVSEEIFDTYFSAENNLYEVVQEVKMAVQ